MSPIIITITGPESSGKTTLAKLLAAHFGINFIPEYAREYLTQRNISSYTKRDFLEIAQEQIKQWQHFRNLPLIIKDTDATVLRIWEQVKFKENSAWLDKVWREDMAHLTLLCKPDFDWEPDLLRENPEDREWLFNLYLEALNERGYPYYILYGKIESRLAKAIRLIGQFK